jgi:hypothetical protein
MTFKQDALALYNETYGSTPEDKTKWDAFNECEPSWEDMKDLLHEEGIRDHFRARAMMVLYTPAEEQFPFLWRKPGGERHEHMNQFFHSQMGMEHLPKRLRNFFARFLCIAIEAGRQESWKAAHEVTCYNACIRTLLQRVDENIAEELFSHYALWQPDCIIHVEPHPLEMLLNDPDVPMQWKRAADRTYRMQIRNTELSNLNECPLLTSYARYLRNLFNRRDNLPYDQDLYVEQVTFFVENDLTRNGHHSVGDIPKTLRALRGHPALCVLLVREYVIGPKAPFILINDYSESIAKNLLEIFDGEIATELKQKIHDYRRDREREKSERDASQKEYEKKRDERNAGLTAAIVSMKQA